MIAENLLKDDKARYVYDGFNRNTKVETFNGNIQINHYDAEGLHHEMEENGKLVSFIYRGDEVIAEESQEDKIRYIRTSVLLASDAESARTYYHYASDEMGSITHVVDENEEILNHYEYDAWGNLTVCEEKVHNRFKFNGQQYDPISQQYYLRARYYNPVIGRFTQEDSYNVDGLNLYVYCRNNPVSYVDPSGNICEKAANRIREKIANGDPVSNNERRKLAAYERNEARKQESNNTSQRPNNQKDSEHDNNFRNILNVGAGDNPIPCAINIDINPNAANVIYGDANDLSQFASGQFDHVIALNPYGYNLLESDVPRVLKDGGVMSVTGNYSNKYFKKIYNASPEILNQAGFEVVSKGSASSIFMKYGGKVTGGARSTQGTPLQIVLRKVGGE